VVIAALPTGICDGDHLQVDFFLANFL